MAIDTLLIDLDNTLLDFYAAEDQVLGRALTASGIAPTPAVLASYQRINHALWRDLEHGEIAIDALGVRRFALLLAEEGITEVDAQSVSDTYEAMLQQVRCFMPGAEVLLDALSGAYRLYLVTNGMGSVQYGRVAQADIGHYFDGIFVSSDIGHVKPSRAFFAACFARMADFDPARTAIIGDGLNSDIRGGIQAGIHTLWYNPRHEENTGPWQPEAETDDLLEIPKILKMWQ
ncbi:MAG: YjjG family noncanonical pyrimidine nucleotidase [Peptococcaceae bacterium]|nr:YjjG family noncanonical pyrimidine nucleotidase [Peptococcaceae bacterium]